MLNITDKIIAVGNCQNDTEPLQKKVMDDNSRIQAIILTIKKPVSKNIFPVFTGVGVIV